MAGAEAGDPNAQFMFGYFLDVGLGGRKDKAAAMPEERDQTRALMRALQSTKRRP